MRGTSEAFGRHEVFPCHLVASRHQGLFQVSQSPLSSDMAVKLAGKDRFRGYQAETTAVRQDNTPELSMENNFLQHCSTALSSHFR